MNPSFPPLECFSILDPLKQKINYFYFLDYVNGGELFTHLYQRESFTEDQVRIYIAEIILALEQLHKVSINQTNHASNPFRAIQVG